MNLQPLYEVKERLEHAAIAGTGLLGEDFRLKRAKEGFLPLASANAVFGRIDAGLEKLLSAPQEQRGGLLLDVLALVDAVVYTQGSTGCAGELEPLPERPGICRQVSYGQLHPLLEALCGTGGGRLNVVQEAWENHPEYFSDYRVLPALVKGLGDSYAELADLDQRILQEMGPIALPLLKEGFCAEGNREMFRRAALIDSLAGGAENDFYLEQLPLAKKDVCPALVYALRHDPSNTPMVLELCRGAGKGESGRLVHRVLLFLSTPEAESYLEALAEKSLDRMLDYLTDVDSPLASRMTARLFLKELEAFEKDRELPLTEQTKKRLTKIVEALVGKTGPEIQESYRRAAALEDALNRPMAEGDGTVFLRFPDPCTGGQEIPFHQAVPLCLMLTLKSHPDKHLCRLALELYEQYGDNYLPAALAAQIISLTGEESYAWAEAQFYRSGLLGKKVRREAVEAFQIVLRDLDWNGKETGYFFSKIGQNLIGQPCCSHVPVPLLDPRWFSLLMDAGGALDDTLWRLLRYRGTVPGISEKVSRYLYRMVLRAENRFVATELMQILSGLNWQDWDGFLVKRAEKLGQVSSWWEIEELLEHLPVSDAEKANQLRELNHKVLSRTLKVRSGHWPDNAVKELIAQWESQPK